jgi:hypothetical protein
MNNKLYQLVVQSYKIAIANGYDLDEWSALEVAQDMCAYDADIEDYSEKEVLMCVESYRKNRYK